MASDRNHPERRSVEWKYLPVIGAPLPFVEKKGSKRYRIELASSTLAEKAFEKYQRRLNRFERNTSIVHRRLDYMELQKFKSQAPTAKWQACPMFSLTLCILPLLPAI